MALIVIFLADIVFFYKVKQIFLFEFELTDDHVLNAKIVYFLRTKMGLNLDGIEKLR